MRKTNKLIEKSNFVFLRLPKCSENYIHLQFPLQVRANLRLSWVWCLSWTLGSAREATHRTVFCILFPQWQGSWHPCICGENDNFVRLCFLKSIVWKHLPQETVWRCQSACGAEMNVTVAPLLHPGQYNGTLSLGGLAGVLHSLVQGYTNYVI